MTSRTVLNKNKSPHTDLPWYRQFWPWFIISLPASAVIAGITTVIIAFVYEDSLVVDNYYKAGLAINRVLTQQDRARELGITALVSYNEDSHVLLVKIPTGIKLKIKTLEIRLVHSTQAKKDKFLLLKNNLNNNFSIKAGAIQKGWWTLFIESVDGEWQINQRILFPMQGQQLIQSKT